MLGCTCSASTLVSDTCTVVVRSSKLRPRATMSAWLVVTRKVLLGLVGQLAKKASVVMNPTRGMASTSSAGGGVAQLGQIPEGGALLTRRGAAGSPPCARCSSRPR